MIRWTSEGTERRALPLPLPLPLPLRPKTPPDLVDGDGETLETLASCHTPRSLLVSRSRVHHRGLSSRENERKFQQRAPATAKQIAGTGGGKSTLFLDLARSAVAWFCCR